MREVKLKNLDRVDAMVDQVLRASRIPGIGLAIVTDDATIFAKGFGYRDLSARLPMTAQTLFPIGSTTKAFNATLLGTLVERGQAAWDVPVQEYLPRFYLGDPLTSSQVTLRDLITMRTGLPRHDWVWLYNPITRPQVVERLRHLPTSAGFRERFQYNNITVTAAGYIAETIAGRSWDELLQQRIFDPLLMTRSMAAVDHTSENRTLSYHENRRRELLVTLPRASAAIAPAGSSVHSTVEDMARWIAFNLGSGQLADRAVLRPETLAEIHSPQVIIAGDPAAPSPHAAYALGWFVDSYNGQPRLSHTGYISDVNVDISLFPKQRLGMVAFTNFAAARLASLLSQHVFDLLMDLEPAQSFEQALQQYEKRVDDVKSRDSMLRRIENTTPSHDLAEYTGNYEHVAYGKIAISQSGTGLTLERGNLALPLEHWHYDTWIVAENDLFEIHKPHVFDRASRVLFDADREGAMAGLSMELEPAAAPIRFGKI